MNRVVAALAGGLIAICAALTGAAPAQAHAELVSSSPLDGAMLTALPSTVELTFSEPVGRPADIVVLGPDGNPLSAGDVVTLDRVVSVTLGATGAAVDGAYTVSYQVTSADGHLITGTTAFMVHADGSSPIPAAGPSASGSVSTTDADPLVVGALVLGLAAALLVALAAIRRVLLAEPAGT